MKKLFYLLAVTACIQPSVNAQAQLSPRFKVYFNQPVNTSVSSGTDAIYVNGTFMDTLISYINKAKYTIDVAQYDYNQNSYFSNIATAVDSAYARGVRVRWIYNSSSSNGGLSGLDTGIHTLGSPTGNAYGIMHNKFVIIDANAPDSTTTWLHTSSMDWSSEMMYYDYNNALFIQSQQLAQAYQAEFNMMWGDTGAVPNATNAKFGPYKTNLGQHNFIIDGIQVDLYFSPSDGVNGQILNTIATADSQLCLGMYDITENNDAEIIAAKYQAGVSTYAIVDQYSASNGGQYSTLSSALGNHVLEYSNNSSIYHNKFLIVDQCSPSSDPQVLTGSHNWTKSADEYNDENTLIIHDPTIANLYYQSFYGNFKNLGGSIMSCYNKSTGIENVSSGDVEIYPNPANNGIWQMEVTDGWVGGTYTLNDMNGRIIVSGLVNQNQTIVAPQIAPGVYFATLQKDGKSLVRKVVKM